MNLEQLHRYLGELIATGTSGKLPVVIPGVELPVEVCEAISVDGSFEADPFPLTRGSYQLSETAVMLVGRAFDIRKLDSSRNAWHLDPVPPAPDRS
ncbi:hypothetical protein PZT57_26855 [Pseudomonas aeruginosa]|uniref:hypothetical protein n=1 Tax=Pseudomonas aeruginosa TaxID=287 RepID=UPI002B26541A|nr:hypothetical protein [Pseudomonas aeruginosa]MEA8592271.1 hypothetical protein [Pseudomonas aeruginosa]